jgi:hypothetical protein
MMAVRSAARNRDVRDISHEQLGYLAVDDPACLPAGCGGEIDVSLDLRDLVWGHAATRPGLRADSMLCRSNTRLDS